MKRKIEAGKIVFTFEGYESLVFNSNKASLPNISYATMHGFNQRIGDAAASSKTEGERRDAVQQMIAHYESGSDDWNIKGDGKRAAPQSATILAIAKKRNCTYAEAEAWIAEKFLADLAGE